MEPEFDKQLDRLADAAEALAGELEPEDVLQTITETAAMVTGASYAALGVIGEDQSITRFITHGVSEEQIRRIRRRPVRSTPSRSARRARPRAAVSVSVHGSRSRRVLNLSLHLGRR